jgi:hemerythrin-like domain-containing protein
MTLRLKAEHDALRVALRAFAEMMPPHKPADLTALMRGRTAFSNLFRQHLSYEESRIATLRTGHVSCPAEQAQREHGNRLRVLFLAYSDHIKSWTPAGISAQWTRYRIDVLALQKGLYQLMDWEEKVLHPLLAGR